MFICPSTWSVYLKSFGVNGLLNGKDEDTVIEERDRHCNSEWALECRRRPQSRTLLETSTDFPLAGILFFVGIGQEGGLALESPNIVLKTVDWWAQSCGLCSLFNKHKVFKNHKMETKKMWKKVCYMWRSSDQVYVCYWRCIRSCFCLSRWVAIPNGMDYRPFKRLWPCVLHTCGRCILYDVNQSVLKNASIGYFPWVKQRYTHFDVNWGWQSVRRSWNLVNL